MMPQFVEASPAGERHIAMPGWKGILLAGGSAALFAASLVLRLHTEILDLPVARVLNHSATENGFLASIAAVAIRPSIQACALVSLAWGCWFARSGRASRDRMIIGAAAAMAAAVAAHVVQDLMPTVLKPIFDPSTQIVAPPALGDIDYLRARANPLSQSFPSERTTLFGGLAVAIFNADRRIGLAALGCTFGVELCRVYLGLHYPSDVAGSLCLAAAAVWLAEVVTPRAMVRMFAVWERASAPSFYACMFAASYLVASS